MLSEALSPRNSKSTPAKRPSEGPSLLRSSRIGRGQTSQRKSREDDQIPSRVGSKKRVRSVLPGRNISVSTNVREPPSKRVGLSHRISDNIQRASIGISSNDKDLARPSSDLSPVVRVSSLSSLCRPDQLPYLLYWRYRCLACAHSLLHYFWRSTIWRYRHFTALAVTLFARSAM